MEGKAYNKKKRNLGRNILAHENGGLSSQLLTKLVELVGGDVVGLHHDDLGVLREQVEHASSVGFFLDAFLRHDDVGCCCCACGIELYLVIQNTGGVE